MELYLSVADWLLVCSFISADAALAYANEDTYKKNAGAFTVMVMHLRYGTFRREMLLALLLDDHDRKFIQEIQRYEHKHKREGVATGSDDCCKYQQTYNSMTPIFAQE